MLWPNQLTNRFSRPLFPDAIAKSLLSLRFLSGQRYAPEVQ
jgi:hypothetical protein